LLIEILSRQRSREQKATIYRSVLAALSSTLGLAATDLMMTFQINGDEDWSFGNGEAQFLTGDLR
jgi:phenylpyruvate tautomerase PptA (4-oxalocrotonate tautomerase family)